MDTRKNKHSSVPPSIQIIFNNDKLELMKVLCLMNAFSLQSKKQRTVAEILFYYSLVNFNLINLFNRKLGMENSYTPSPNLYFRFQIKINGILLNMSQLQFIEVRGDISKKLENITVKLLPEGKKFFEEHNSDYFLNLLGNYTDAFEKVYFSLDNVKVIRGQKQWGE